MYESHFGFSGPPFQLNPDPAFYFDSRGHSNALAYLKFGAHQGEGFIIVTGEIGAGKTTLVRTLLAGLDSANVVAAQVVSTQLEAGDLLRAILAAYGVPASGSSKAHLIASLEGFLTALAARGQRALLIVDEAQNLKHEAVEELRMLSNFQLGNHALLQSFLIGQPELRTLLQSKSMEQLRQRVIASCHLGPLDEAETRAYIEHRLRRVGWKDTPHFTPEAFDAIHRWTDGVPRRINRLCNRLLLAAFLSGQPDISPTLVKHTAAELRNEIGEAGDDPELSPVAMVPTPSARASGDSATVRHLQAGADLRAPLLCLVDTRTDFLKIGALAQALQEHPTLPQLVCVHLGSQDSLRLGNITRAELPRPRAELHLGLALHGLAACAGASAVHMDQLLDEFEPRAVLSMGQSDAMLVCTLLAHERGVAVLRLDAGERAAGSMNGALADRVADVLYTRQLLAYYTLEREGISPERVHCIGSLAADFVALAAPHAVAPGDEMAPEAPEFGLVSIDLRHLPLDVAVPLLSAVARELPLVWALPEAALATLKTARLDAVLAQARVTLVPALGYLEDLGWLQSARCLLADTSAELREEAVALGLPLVLADADAPKAVRAVLQSDAGRADIPQYWDGLSARRIVKHLRTWLAPQSQSETAVSTGS